MAKITFEDGTVIEGTVDELKQMGVKFPVAEMEESGEYRKVADRKPKVGDFIKFSKTGDNDVTVGSYYEIMRFDSDGDPEFFDNDGDIDVAVSDEGDVYAIYEIVRATDEEVAEAKRQLERKEVEEKWAKIGRKHGEFKIGDIVRVINAEDSGHINGVISEILGDACYTGNLLMFNVRVTRPSNTGGWLYAEDMELITPVEARFDA